MEFIRLTLENLEKEHICCAIAGNNDGQVMSKKSWLAERITEGLVFLKADVRGKCFIEYILAEAAWVPVEAPGYMYIDCLWVSGQFKGQGLSSQLLERCIQDSRESGKKGLVIVSSDKKRGFLADKKYLLHKGFRVADKAAPYFELLYLPFSEDAPVPEWGASVREAPVIQEGFVLYYTRQCPFTAKYVPLLEERAREKKLTFKSIRIESAEEAKKVPVPFTTFALFYNGSFITHEILSEKKFDSIVEEVTAKS